jgi:CheY-like chemotaxis protein
MDTVARILILEDTVTDKALMEFELQDAGIAFISRWVTTKKDYVQALQDFSPDLILSDYALPQYDGSLAFAEARKRCPDVPFILVTGLFLNEIGRIGECLVQGADDYILKHQLDQLVPAVKKALGINGGESK